MFLDSPLKRVFLIEENFLLSQSLCEGLARTDQFRTRTHDGQGRTLLDNIELYDANVVILDPANLAWRPAQLSSHVKERVPECQMIAYLSPAQEHLAHECLQAGFGGVVSRKGTFQQLLAAIHTALDDGVYIDEAFIAAPQRPGIGLEKRLSDREQVVLAHIARGLSHKEIAQAMGLSIKTVETYKYRGLDKLGVSSRSAVVECALRNNWLGNLSPSDRQAL